MPPVIFSVFSGSASLGIKSGSTDESSSGGAWSAPTLGISFEIVEVVFVMWGFVAFDFWISRHAGCVSCSRSFGSAKHRRVEVERRRDDRGAKEPSRRARRCTDMIKGIYDSIELAL